MLERVVENWLIKANERTFEIPFCQLLTGEGYQVVHLSRHGPFEEGKDIIAIAPDKVPCAYQLMSVTGKVSQKAWDEYLPKIRRLIEIPINHPSIENQRNRRAYLVVNGELGEEVRLEIQHRNREWEEKGYPKLNTIVRGQLLNRLIGLHSDFWPTNLATEKQLLELFLSDGRSNLDKNGFASFLESLLPLHKSRITKRECSRLLASSAVFTTYALSPYHEQENHVALIEGWMIHISLLIAMVEKFKLNQKYWKDTFEVALVALEGAFKDLLRELKERTHLVEGNPLVDGFFYRARVTWLLGLVCTYILHMKQKDPAWRIEEWARDWIDVYKPQSFLWGESATPLFMAIYWYLRFSKSDLEPDGWLESVINAICGCNRAEHPTGLPDPYYDLSQVISWNLGISDNLDRPNFKGRSYSLETLIHLFARRGWRNKLALLWPQITRIDYAEFVPRSSWEFCLHHLDRGVLTSSPPKATQSWSRLKADATTDDKSNIPSVFQDYPYLLLLYVIVFPQRFTKNVAKLIDDCTRAIKIESLRHYDCGR